MASNRTTQADLLRTVYLPRMQVQFNLRSILLQRITRNTSQYAEGKELSLPLHKGQTGGWGWSDSGALPPASHQKVARHTYNYKRMYGRIEIDGPHVEGAHRSEAAERKPYDLETRNLVKQMRHGLNYDLFGDGDGSVAIPASASANNTLVVDSVRGLVDGMRIDILLTSNGAVNGGVSGAEITVNRSTKTVTLTSPAVMADYTDVNSNPTNYKLYRHGSYGQGLNGLNAIVNTANPSYGNLGGIDRTAAGNEYWQANRFHNSGVARRATLTMIEEGRSEIEKRSDGMCNLIICGYEVWALLAEDLVLQKRFSGEKTKLNGWATALMFEDDIPIVRDKHCDPTKMYLLDTTTFELFQNDEGKWMDDDGAVLSRVPNQHAYEATWFRFLQLVCHAPNCNAVIEDLDTALTA